MRKSNGITLVCSRPNCGNVFYRKVSDLRCVSYYCSRSCAVTVNNTKFPKHPGVRKKCEFCNKEFVSRKRYCSAKCHSDSQIVPKEVILHGIQEFYKANGRIPLKREFKYYHATRGRFGTWNKAIVAAGFDPNPVLFSKKYIARDGHVCDSVSEMIIDDWLSCKKINHQRWAPYPGDEGFTVDFVVGDKWIEFFGLDGQLAAYSQLKNRKLELAKKHNIEIIEIYPKHLFPENKLHEVLSVLSSYRTTETKQLKLI